MGLKVLETFGTLWEAGMAKSVLEAEGLPAFIDSETCAAIGVPWNVAQEGVRLLVSEEAIERAAAILRGWDRPAPLQEEGEELKHEC